MFSEEAKQSSQATKTQIEQIERTRRIKEKQEKNRKQNIEQKVIVDLKKTIAENAGKQYIQHLKQAILENDMGVVENILYQIGHDIHVIMRESDAPLIEEIDAGSGEYKILCVRGTAGQRGLLRVDNNGARLNFPNIDDREYNSHPSMRTAVEQLFDVEISEGGLCSIEILSK